MFLTSLQCKDIEDNDLSMSHIAGVFSQCGFRCTHPVHVGRSSRHQAEGEREGEDWPNTASTGRGAEDWSMVQEVCRVKGELGKNLEFACLLFQRQLAFIITLLSNSVLLELLFGIEKVRLLFSMQAECYSTSH